MLALRPVVCVLLVGLLVGLLSIGAQAWSVHAGSPHWQTIAFTVLTFCQLFVALGVRSGRESLASLGIASNLPLAGAVALTFALQLAIIYTPAFQAGRDGAGEGARPGRLDLSRARVDASPYLTNSTGVFARCRTLVATEPMSRPITDPQPCVPIMISEQPRSAASSAITSPGSPTLMWNR